LTLNNKVRKGEDERLELKRKISKVEQFPKKTANQFLMLGESRFFLSEKCENLFKIRGINDV
jgi:hypothetical protein